LSRSWGKPLQAGQGTRWVLGRERGPGGGRCRTKGRDREKRNCVNGAFGGKTGKKKNFGKKMGQKAKRNYKVAHPTLLHTKKAKNYTSFEGRDSVQRNCLDYG